ncbi:unnamed protein product [Spirodela intermedia]|uniref:SUN domain-containing protein n=1 Tax=Spirodela intermedia TaxID=51605 RepID=A0A7I8IAT5_SPIIN|nr:unnamed protein product [Spirodela intermedia]CAA6654463.1 unnamed protein product [Spirodela intermedia]
MAATDPAANNNTSSALDSDSRSDARRRHAVVARKKSATDVVPNGGNSGVGSDQVVATGNNPSRAVRAESTAVLERPRELPHAKKVAVAASTVSPRRRRSTSRPEKPRWLTVLSILTKNCFLLMGLFIVARVTWKWSGQFNGNTHMPFAALDLEDQISDLKSSLKKTAKMMQVQLEVVDQKIGSESGNVRLEMSRKIEERSASLEKELKKLEARSDNLENSLSELKGTGFFSKEEFQKFYSDFKNRQSRPERDEELFTLDELRNYAREVVEKEMEKHVADGLGRVDFALASGGARVVRHSEPYLGKSLWLLVKGRGGVDPNAHKMLQPSFGEPGFVEIKLTTAIIPDSITLEHVAKSVAYDRLSAPKDCRVSAWLEGTSNDGGAEKMRTLVEFSYDLEGSNAQSFKVEPGGAVNMVRFDFSSNHGSSSHTCIYRLRVHGWERPRST